jgi:cytochrome c oxidase subunit 2
LSVAAPEQGRDVMRTLLGVDTSDVYDRTASVYAPIALAVLVLVIGATLAFTWRGARRTTPRGPDEAHRFEIAYALVLAVIVAGLVAVSFHEQGRIDAAKAAPVARGDVRVRVIAAKWTWRFEYPGLGITVAGRPGAPATLTVPAGRAVHIEATSLDVVHGFWIPAMRFQRQLFPGKQVRLTLTFPRPDVMDSGECSMFCGLGHADMRFQVQVLTPAAFEAWTRR